MNIHGLEMGEKGKGFRFWFGFSDTKTFPLCVDAWTFDQAVHKMRLMVKPQYWDDVQWEANKTR